MSLNKLQLRARAKSEMGEQVKSKLRELRRNEEGMTTAEYAVGTIAAAGLGGVLIKLLMSQEVQDLIWKIIQQAFSFLFFS
jgi:Flp pilus assembly pilin Flp